MFYSAHLPHVAQLVPWAVLVSVNSVRMTYSSLMTHPLQPFRDSEHLHIHQSVDSHFNEQLYRNGGTRKRPKSPRRTSPTPTCLSRGLQKVKDVDHDIVGTAKNDAFLNFDQKMRVTTSSQLPISSAQVPHKRPQRVPRTKCNLLL